MRCCPRTKIRSDAPPDKTIAIGSDHGGYRMKEQLKPLMAELGLTIRDVGVATETPADYPDIALEVAELVAAGTALRGVILDGAGIGSAMVANKVPGVRAALCYDKASARNSREHNDSNVLTPGRAATHGDPGGRSPAGLAEHAFRRWTSRRPHRKNHPGE